MRRSVPFINDFSLDFQFLHDSEENEDISPAHVRHRSVTLAQYSVVCENVEFAEISSKAETAIESAFLENKIDQYDAFICLYDVCNADTFSRINSIIQTIRRVKFEPDDKDIPIMLVGNKIDKPNPQIDTEQGKDKGEDLGHPFMEVSAKTGARADVLLNKIVALAYAYNFNKVKVPETLMRVSGHDDCEDCCECCCCSLL